MNIKLRDQEGDLEVKGSVEVTKTQALEVRIDGLGQATMETGHGAPIYLELYKGKLKLYVWADINSEDPTHIIDLDGARESARKE